MIIFIIFLNRNRNDLSTISTHGRGIPSILSVNIEGMLHGRIVDVLEFVDSGLEFGGHAVEGVRGVVGGGDGDDGDARRPAEASRK